MLTIYDHLGNQIKLSDKDYISEGGEGKIYIKNNIVYKIYFDEKNVISDKKLKELSVLSKSNILGPKNHIYNDKRLPIGYTMAYASNTVALPRIFTSSFRDRNNITPNMSVKLVENIMETIQYIHEKDILIVDGNELNYLVNGKNFIESYFIDVDSYQTASYPARVIMPSIKDWKTSGFSKETDWFSFAIIATQIFIGVHPFKGKHPKYTIKDIKERVIDCVSIFNKETIVPPSTRPFDLIPTEYKNWFIDLFEKGKRIAPPQIKANFNFKPQITTILGSDKFIISTIFEATDKITGVSFINGHRIIYTVSMIYIDSIKIPLYSKTCGIVFIDNKAYFVDIENECLKIVNALTKEVITESTIAAQSKVIVDNRIYVICEDKFSQIQITNLGTKHIITIKTSWNILPRATKIYREILIQDILGKQHLVFPIGDGACKIIAVPQLDKKRIIDAKYEDGVAIIMVYYRGNYNRITLIFDDSFSSYVVNEEKDVDLYGINFITLPNKVFCILHDNGDLEIGNKKAAQRNIITHTNINPNIELCHDGTVVHYYLDNTVYSLRMK